MEVVWKWLHDSLKAVCLNPKLIIKNHRPCFSLHVCFLLAVLHCSISKCKRLVKYLHFSRLIGLLSLDMDAISNQTGGGIGMEDALMTSGVGVKSNQDINSVETPEKEGWKFTVN